MNFILHKSTTHMLGEPLDWDSDKATCNSLPVTKGTMSGLPICISYWTPTEVEIANILAGGFVQLTVIGETMAPVMLAVTTE